MSHHESLVRICLDAWRDPTRETSRDAHGKLVIGAQSRLQRAAVQVACKASLSNKVRLRSTPQAYPEVDPSLRITRWHGMATASLFAAQAPATARTALGA